MTAAEPQHRTGREILATAVRRNRGAMVAGTVLMSLYQAGETAVPILLGAIVPFAIQDGNLGALAVSIAALGVVLTTVSLSWRFGMRILQRANTTEAHRWRVAVAGCGLEPVPRAHGLASGEVLTIATEDADQTADIIEVVPLLVSSLIGVLITAIALATANVWLGLLVIAGTAAILTVLSLLSRRIGTGTKEQQAKVARAGAKVADLIAGLRPLHGFGGNHAAFRGYRTLSTDARRQAVTVARVTGAYTGAAIALNAVLAAAVTIIAGWLTIDGQMTIGQLVMAVGLAQFVIEPLKMFSEMPKYVMTARASADRMALVLAAPPVLTPGAHPAVPGGDLRVDDLRYGSLRGVTVTVPAGSFVAIAAWEQQAAADLAAVLSGATPPDDYRGAVFLNDRPTTASSIATLRTTLLVNPAHGEIFAGTLRTNIDPSGIGELVAEAADAAMLTDLVALHADGLDHPVRDRGTNLSGGQRQRLTLARALAADPDILVLHDPTTAVDTVTEHLIAGRIAKLRTDRTTIVLTTSPALLDVADQVVVIDDGVVTATGTHRDLLATDATYRDAVAR